MIKPTLISPDVVLEEYDPKEDAERDTKLLFVKTFIKQDGSRYIHFESVTVRKGDREVSISSHEVNAADLKKKMHNDKIVHLNDILLDSELRLTEPRINEGSDLVPTPSISESKDTTISPNAKSLDEKIAAADVEVANDLTTAEEDNDTLYRSDDATKNRIEALFNQAISGEFKGKPISIGRLTDEGKVYLEQISGIAFRENIDFVLNPSDLMHIYKDHFGNNEKDKGQNIPLDIEDVRSLADVISSPEKIVFFKEGEGSNRNMFYFFKEAKKGTYNLMEIYSDRKGNLTAKTFYKTRKGSNQRVIDIEKSLLRTSETSLVHSLSDAKIPQMFETTSVEDNFSAREETDVFEDNANYGRGVQRTLTPLRDAAVGLAEQLNTPIRIVENVEDITGNRPKVQERKRVSKGWYDVETGEVVIVLPNATSDADKKETVVKTEPQQPNNAVSTGSSLSAEDKSGISTTEPNGEPTVSISKDTTISPNAKSLDEKIAEAEADVNTNNEDAAPECVIQEVLSAIWQVR